MIKKLKIFVRIFIGPLFWLRNIIYEWIYFPRIDSKIEGLDCISSNGFYVYPEKLDVQSVSRLKKDFNDLQILLTF